MIIILIILSLFLGGYSLYLIKKSQKETKIYIDKKINDLEIKLHEKSLYLLDELTDNEKLILDKLKEINNQNQKDNDTKHEQLISNVLTPLATKNWNFVPEHKIECPRGGSFKVDIAGFYQGELRCVFLLKAVEASYNKNSHNYANTCEGETGRIFDHPERGNNLSLFTIDWIPNKVRSPTPKNKNRVEITKVPDMNLSENRWNTLLREQYKNAHVSFCKIRFDYDEDVGATNVKGTEKLLRGLRRVFNESIL